MLRNRTVKVRYDGETSQFASDPSHLLPGSDDDSKTTSGETRSDSGDSDIAPGDDFDGSESSGTGPVQQDADVNEDEGEQGPESEADDDERCIAVAVGDTVEVGGNKWKRVRGIYIC